MKKGLIIALLLTGMRSDSQSVFGYWYGNANVRSNSSTNNYLVELILQPEKGYVSGVLEDAKVYASHANKKNIDSDDIQLAVQCKLDHSFTNPPPRDVSNRSCLIMESFVDAITG